MRTIRLSPDRVLLWRDPDTIQLGRTRPVVLRAPAPWQHAVLRALAHGVNEGDLHPLATIAGAPEGAVAVFLDRIAEALVSDPPPVTLQLHILDPCLGPELIALFTEVCAGLGATVVQDPPDSPGGSSQHAGVDVVHVLISAHLCLPRQSAPWMARDLPHAPVVFEPDSVSVGPVVLPGTTACLQCLAEEQRSADPHWSVLAAQLIGKPMPHPPPQVVAEAATQLMTLVSERVTRASASRSVESDRHLRRRWRMHLPVATCGCRSLAESATALAGSDQPSSPTRPSAWSLPE